MVAASDLVRGAEQVAPEGQDNVLGPCYLMALPLRVQLFLHDCVEGKMAWRMFLGSPSSASASSGFSFPSIRLKSVSDCLAPLKTLQRGRLEWMIDLGMSRYPWFWVGLDWLCPVEQANDPMGRGWCHFHRAQDLELWVQEVLSSGTFLPRQKEDESAQHLCLVRLRSLW